MIEVVNMEIVENEVHGRAQSPVSEWSAERGYSEHFNAKTIQGAVLLLHHHKGAAKIIAGGVDLIGLMNSKLRLP